MLGVQSLLGPQEKQATTRSGRVCKLTERFLSMDREPAEHQDTATHSGEPTVPHDAHLSRLE